MPRAMGFVSTSATTTVPVYDQTYNEQTANGARSLKSASANDAAAGTGVRQVRVTYYRLAAGVITGPFTEVVSLNGVTAVPMADASPGLALCEKIEAVSVGSGGVAAGAITLFANNDGTGTAIAVLPLGGVRTNLAHHYVPSGSRCFVNDLNVIGGDAAAAQLQLVAASYPAAGAQLVDLPVTEQIGTTSAVPRGVPLADREHSVIAGPARVRLLVTPGNANAQVTRAGFGYYDKAAGS